MATTPICCEQAKLAIRLWYVKKDLWNRDYFAKTKPLWMMRGWHEDWEDYRNMAITFCPFCGKVLPDIKLKEPLPEKVMTITDGGYYCDICKERLSHCDCTQPTEMWEIIDE